MTTREALQELKLSIKEGTSEETAEMRALLKQSILDGSTSNETLTNFTLLRVLIDRKLVTAKTFDAALTEMRVAFAEASLRVLFEDAPENEADLVVRRLASSPLPGEVLP